MATELRRHEILALCPTRGRPQIAERMIESFYKTSARAHLKLFVDFDDPCLDQYREIFGKYPCSFIIQEREPITKTFNETVKMMPNYQFYHQSNDDFIYLTPGWDRRFIQTFEDYGEGIVYGNDLLRSDHLPVAPCVSSGIVRALGWLQLPTLTHLYGDEVWRYIGKALHCLYYLEDVIIEHRHWNKDRSLIDESYIRTNSTEMFKKDRAAFQAWVNNGAKADIEKVRGVLNGR